MILNLFFIVFVFNLNKFADGFSCKGENREDVDFVFFYKLPFVFSLRSLQDVIYDYLYKTNLDITSHWGFSRNNIRFNPEAIPNIILDPLFNADEAERRKYNYILYNDKPPNNNYISLTLKGTSTNYGYSRVLIWRNSGKAIWILHSFPSAPKQFSTMMSGFPTSNVKTNKDARAHNFLCVNVNINDIETIIKHLIITKVKVYDINLDASGKLLLGSARKSLYTVQTKGINKKDNQLVSQSSITELKTVGNNRLLIISRQRKDSEENFWKKVSVAVGDQGMSIKSANLGAMSKSTSDCKTTIHDVVKLKIRPLAKQWGLDLDYSQWAICVNTNCVCISNLDRRNFNNKETGTALCFWSKTLNQALRNTIRKVSCKS